MKCMERKNEREEVAKGIVKKWSERLRRQLHDEYIRSFEPKTRFGIAVVSC